MAAPAMSLMPDQSQTALQSLLNRPAVLAPARVDTNRDPPQDLLNVFYVAAALSLSFATRTVVIRIYTKRFLLRSLGYEDCKSRGFAPCNCNNLTPLGHVNDSFGKLCKQCNTILSLFVAYFCRRASSASPFGLLCVQKGLCYSYMGYTPGILFPGTLYMCFSYKSAISRSKLTALLVGQHTAVTYAITVTFVTLPILVQDLRTSVPSREGDLPLVTAIHA